MKSSLSSTVKYMQFAVLVEHCVDYPDKKNHGYKQHLVQGIQLQCQITKRIKNLTFEQLQDTAIGLSTSLRPSSSGRRIIFAIILLQSKISCFKWEKNGEKLCILYHKGSRQFLPHCNSNGKSSMSAPSNIYQGHFYSGSQLVFVAQTSSFCFL